MPPTFPAGSYPARVVADGASHYWRLGESSGTVATDVIGGSNGTVSGGVTLAQPGALADGNKAMTFNSGRIDAGQAPGTNFLAGSYTIEAWVYRTGGSNYYVIAGKGRHASPTGWRAFIAATDHPVLFSDSDTTNPYPASNTLVIGQNQWKHVVWGYDAVAAKVFYAVDGVYEALSTPNKSVTSVDPVTIGQDSASGYAFLGGIDEVAIYPRALTAAQIAAHYALRTYALPITANALVGTARLNAFRLDYLPVALRKQRDTTVKITLDGVPLRVRLGSLTIKDIIADAPTTCSFTVDNSSGTPPVGKRLRITLGIDPQVLLFVGTLQTADQSYVGRPNIREWKCTGIDDTMRADWRRPFGAWENISATNVAYDLVTNFAPGFTANNVQLNLPPVTLYLDGTERMNGALKLIAKLIGGYFYWEDYDLHLFVGDEPGTNPDDITDGHTATLIDSPPLVYTTDDTQLRTRVYGKGHSEDTITAVAANETRLPIGSAVLFTAGGGKAIVEWQRIAYTGTVLGGGGALVGPGVVPSSAPVAAVADGSGVTPGGHYYAYGWVTAAGETPPSPIAVVTLTGGQVGAQTFSVSQGVQFGGPPAGTTLTYAMFIADAASSNFYSLPSAYLSIVSNGNRPTLFFTTTADMRGRVVYFFRNDNNGQGWIGAGIPIQGSPVGSWSGNPFPPGQPVGYGQQWTDQLVSFGGSGIAAPPGPSYVGPLTGGRVILSGISAGPSGTLSRKVYRSAANDAQLRLLTTLADNTTLTYTDALADASLGANAPVSDTSALQMAAGTVLPGATSMPISGSGWVVPGGGWAVIGNGDQVIRYTGMTGATISGIPSGGIGAILAPVSYNTTITGAAMLTGVSGNALPIREGAPCAIWVQCDDVAKQQAYASRVGGTGIVEHLIQDERRGEVSLNALCNADLAQYGTALVTVRYASFDPKTRSGRRVRFSLTSQLLAITLMIQEVTIDQFGASPTTMPRFTVTASNIYTSLEDLLRRMVGTLEEGF